MIADKEMTQLLIKSQDLLRQESIQDITRVMEFQTILNQGI